MTTTIDSSAVIDTSVLLAFFNETDDFHHQAVRLIVSTAKPFILLDIILNEVIALVRKRASNKDATQLAQKITDSKIFHWDQLKLLTVKKSLIKFILHNGRYSLVDCEIATYCQSHGLPVASFDKHFKTLNIRYWNP